MVDTTPQVLRMKGQETRKEKPKMKVNGYQLKEAIKRWEARKEPLLREFRNSFFRKASQTGRMPSEIEKDILKTENSICALQEAQAKYNLQITVSYFLFGEEQRMTLMSAVKMIGGVGRMEGLWKAESSKEEDPYDSQRLHYGATNAQYEWPKRTMLIKDIVETAANKNAQLTALRAGIAEANSKELNLDIDSSLFQ